MIFGKTSEGYHAHKRISFYTGILLTGIQAIICIPPIAHMILGVIMGLPADMENSAYIALLTGIPLQFIFAQRTPYMTTLFVHKATGRAYAASFSIGQLFISLSGYVIGAFAARAPNPDVTLPVYYAVISIFNAFSFAATRLSATVITFYEEGTNREIIKKFTFISGLVLGIIPLDIRHPFPLQMVLS